MNPRAAGWCLFLSIAGKLAALAFPAWLPDYPGWAALAYFLVDALAFAGFWPVPPAGTPKGSNPVIACVGAVYIGCAAITGWILAVKGSPWVGYGINFGAWLGIMALMNPGKEGGNDGVTDGN